LTALPEHRAKRLIQDELHFQELPPRAAFHGDVEGFLGQLHQESLSPAVFHGAILFEASLAAGERSEYRLPEVQLEVAPRVAGLMPTGDLGSGVHEFSGQRVHAIAQLKSFANGAMA